MFMEAPQQLVYWQPFFLFNIHLYHSCLWRLVDLCVSGGHGQARKKAGSILSVLVSRTCGTWFV
jgi:hypothetical protein